MFNRTGKMQFWQRLWKNSATRPKKFTSLFENEKKISQAVFFFLYGPMVNRMQFRQPLWALLQAGRNKVNSKSRKNWKKILKKSFPQNVILDSAREKSFDEPGDIFFRGAETCSLNSRKWRNEMFPSTWIFLPECLVWTRRMHFLQTYQKILENRPKSFLSISKNNGKRISKKNFPSNLFFGLRRQNQFWQRWQKLFHNKPKIFRSMSENEKK